MTDQGDSIMLINGYGVVDMEKPFFQHYFRGIKKILKKYRPATVICSWGYTVSSTVSEAASLKKELIAIWYQWEIILEEDALSTYDNIKRTGRIIQKEFSEVDSIIVCAANTHIYKCICMGIQLFAPCFGETAQEEDAIQFMQRYFLDAQDHNWWGDVTIPYKNRLFFEWVDVQYPVEQSWKQIISWIIESAYLRHEHIHDEFIAWRKEYRANK